MFQFESKCGRVWVEIILVGAMLILIAFAAFGFPYLIKEHNARNARICRENLLRIDACKGKWALDHKMDIGAKPNWNDLIGPGMFEERPICPSGGDYTIRSVRDNATCSYGTGDSSTSTDDHVL